MFDDEGTPGGNDRSADRARSPAHYVAAQRRRRKPEQPAALDLHRHGRRRRPPRCPPPRPSRRRSSSASAVRPRCKVGEVVRFENEGFLVHMNIAFPVRSKRAAQQARPLPEGGQGKAGVQAGQRPRRSASTARSPGRLPAGDDHREARLVRPGLLHGHAGRPRPHLCWGWSAPSTSSSSDLTLAERPRPAPAGRGLVGAAPARVPRAPGALSGSASPCASPRSSRAASRSASCCGRQPSSLARLRRVHDHRLAERRDPLRLRGQEAEPRDHLGDGVDGQLGHRDRVPAELLGELLDASARPARRGCRRPACRGRAPPRASRVATSSWWTSWNGTPGSGSTGRRIGTPSSRLSTGPGSRSEICV